MAKIANRDKDQSERKLVLEETIRPTVTGATYPIGVVPFPAQVLAGYEAAYGLSGAPVGQIKVHRFIPGTGVTIINGIFSSMAVTAFGTSGLMTHTIVGATANLLMPDDVLFYETAVANTAVASTSVSVVIQAIEDIKTMFGAANADI
jgi:hypothetical protein